jgi:hypothetical protein
MSGAINCDPMDIHIPKKPPHKSASEHRRATKPIMEKRRRARINSSLNELKSLILDALNKDPSRHSKLEKADILEMTVRHLQNMQRQQMVLEMARDPGVVNKFRAGFTECATEVSRYVNKIDGVDGGTKQRLLNHLSGCVSSINTVATSATPAFPAFPGMAPTADGRHLQVHIPMPAGMYTSEGAVNLSTANDLNNNRRGGIESKMTTPPPSGNSQFSFQFPPSTGLSTPTTPSTPRGLSITVSPSAFAGPASTSSDYNSFSYPSPSSRYEPYRREQLGSISPCSRSSLGSFSPNSDSNDLQESGEVWRPW